MSYKILKSFWELLAPQSIRRPVQIPATRDCGDYDEIIATNEVGEVTILHLPKEYSLSYK
jgi:hypothetical protein